MPPTLLLIRHAEALHNVTNDWSLHDPPLSELGEQQCAELRDSLKKNKTADEIEVIVVSSMRRTLQTASLGLDWLINEKGIKVLPDAGWQETADKLCDTGSPISVLESEFPNFDFSIVDPLFPDKTTNLATNPYAYTRRAILARGQTCLANLYARPEKVIAVVSHSGFLRTAICHCRFFNADWRVFDFDEEAMAESRRRKEGTGSADGEEGEFLLKEWKETEGNGGGMGRSEKGIVAVLPTDFPPDDEVDDGDAVEEGLGKEKEKVPQWMRRERFQREELLKAGC